ncbi:hypothetical protein ACH4UV_14955 [Streptomyces sp. NPDC020802]|uniref:SCO4402 family protein n=1 Tax=Streptomyces sp. NPDC020802 TaxID=3365094 RepID=UPI0037AC3092
MEQPELMPEGVEFPDARLQVVASVESLADFGYQQRVWVEGNTDEGAPWDNFDLVVHILFDDTRVLENPGAAVGQVLRSPEEARAMQALASVLSPLIDELGDVADDVYLASPRWPAVVEAARAALEAMRAVH